MDLFKRPLGCRWRAESIVYLFNGEKLATLTSYSTTGSIQITFGDLNPSGTAPLKGDNALFLLYGHRMTESDILLYHKCFCDNR